MWRFRVCSEGSYGFVSGFARALLVVVFEVEWGRFEFRLVEVLEYAKIGRYLRHFRYCSLLR